VACLLAIIVAVSWCVHWLAGDAFPHLWRLLAVKLSTVVVVALVVAATTHNSHKAYTKALDGLASRQRSAAIDASGRGAVPTDAAVRDAAIRVGEVRLAAARRWRRIWLILACVFGLGLAFEATGPFSTGPSSALAPTPDQWLAVGLMFCAAVAAWYVSRRTEQRLVTLRAPTDIGKMALGGAG
jgi:hypothetical protein